MSGRMTTRISESSTSSRTAMMMPPIAMIGARIIMLSAIITTICTCWTSLVLRVMSDGGAELVDLGLREGLDLAEDRGAHVSAERHRRLRAEVDADDGGRRP